MASIKTHFFWHTLTVRGLTYGLMMLLCSATLLARAQGVVFDLQTESALTLSISQEADEAIDRAQRWLAQQTVPSNRVDVLLRNYALTPAGAMPFRLYRCDITPLEHAMPPPEAPDVYTNLTATLAETRTDAKRLFALQRDIPLINPPSNWREILALRLINSQAITAQGGHWGSSENTLWAILTLRALLNESTPVQLVE